MTCRNVSIALVLCGLLAGCSTYYAARRDLGIDTVDPPRQPAATTVVMPAQPMPPATMQPARSEEHTSELQSLMRISYAVFCLKKKKINTNLNSQARPLREEDTPEIQ